MDWRGDLAVEVTDEPERVGNAGHEVAHLDRRSEPVALHRVMALVGVGTVSTQQASVDQHDHSGAAVRALVFHDPESVDHRGLRLDETASLPPLGDIGGGCPYLTLPPNRVPH